MNKIKEIRYLLFILPLLLIGCQSGVNNVEEDTKLDPEIEKMKQILIENGFPGDLIEVRLDKKHFIVDKDIVIPFEQVINEMKTKQAYVTSNGLVLLSNVSSITVKAHSSVPSDWKNALQDAVGYWNTVNNTQIYFTFITSGVADITVYSDISIDAPNDVKYLGICTIARAKLPSSGNPGNAIGIALDYRPNGASCNLGTVTYDSKVLNMVHELGHTIGFHHTNWSSLPNQPSGTTIVHTPSADASSVMNGGMANNNWNGFSNYDELAAKILYPPMTTPSIGSAYWVSEQNSSMTVELNPDFYGIMPITVYYKTNSSQTNWTELTKIHFPYYTTQVNVPYDPGDSSVYLRIRGKSHYGNYYTSYSSIMEFLIEGSTGGGCDPWMPC